MKILIAQIGHYGDMVLMTPMLRLLKEAQPQARLHVLASRRNHAIIRSHPLVERVLVYEKRIPALVRLLAHIRRERYDVWIDPKDHFSRESALFATFARFCGVGQTIGFNRPDKPVFTIGLPEFDEREHCVTKNCAALTIFAPLHIEMPPTPPRPELFCKADAERFVADFRAERTKPCIVANISAGSPTRYWRQEHWKTLLRNLGADRYDIVLSSTPDDKPLLEDIHIAVPHTRIFPSRSIMDVVSLVKASTLVLTPDTAVIHIAAAFNVPCVALYNAPAWNFHKFAPLSSIHAALQPPSGHEYLRDIQPEVVLQAARELGMKNWE